MVDKLQKLAEEIQQSISFSKEILSAYTQLDRRIHKIEDENEAFDTRNTLQNEKKGVADRLKAQIQTVLNVIESTINRHIDLISDFVSQGKDNLPVDISSNSIAKLGENKLVRMGVLMKIAKALDCKV